LAKNLKLNIKNAQLAKALNLKGTKKPKKAAKAKAEPEKVKEAEEKVEEAPAKRVKARSRSAFAPEEEAPVVEEPQVVEGVAEEAAPPAEVEKKAPEEVAAPKVEKKAEKAPAAAEKKKEEERPGAKPAKGKPPRKGKEFRDFKPRPKGAAGAPGGRPFDSRDKFGLAGRGEPAWRRRRPKRPRSRMPEQAAVRPTELTVRLPITIKDLAAAMKVKSSQLVQKLFMQGEMHTLNDLLDDETTVLLLGEEVGCAITIDTSEEERLRITDRTVTEEIEATDAEKLVTRGPVVAFMGHVDHGKTSLIDHIRKTNVVAGEAGAITQHIGAFQATTASGVITILDTPGHEAFTAMRARGAEVTDVVVLVVAGDEGLRAQTMEAIQHARAAGVIILVAINKCDKPGFDADNVYRQLSEAELLPEKWGGEIVTVNCSATTGEGLDELAEMIALQSEVLELKGDPTARARGSVLESEMHKGLGAVATVLVQNGTLRHGDPVVFDDLWGRIKTMKDESGHDLTEAGPGTPVAITGLSGVPNAGSEFIVVSSEKEAREIAEARELGQREKRLQKKRLITTESLLQDAAAGQKKVLNLILRADVQGSLEALKTSLQKIESDKAEINVIFEGVGAIAESDVELAMASNAAIVGFHTHVESHADEIVKRNNVAVHLHDVIYHAIDKVTELLTETLEKVAEEHEMGKAEGRELGCCRII